VAGPAGLDLGHVLQVETLLQFAKAGAAARVEADDLAVHDRRPVQGFAQGLDHVGELDILRVAVAAQQGELLAVEAGQDAQPVVLGLEDPVRVVERLGQQRAQHRLGGSRHRIAAPAGGLRSACRSRCGHGAPARSVFPALR
jgi:hypothetical protein